MYTAQEIVYKGEHSARHRVWANQIACLRVDRRDIDIQRGVELISALVVVLVLKGEIYIEYDKQELRLQQNDMHTYTPGIPTHMTGASEDYEGLCLIIDEEILKASALSSDFLSIIYFPIAELSKPVLKLNPQQAKLLAETMMLIHQQINQPNDYQRESLIALCKVLGYNILSYQQQLIERHRLTNQAERLFHKFVALVATDYKEHRQIKHYADKLYVSASYLSRIVKVASRRTVMSFIEHALLDELKRRLKMTEDSLGQIAFDLNFSDQSALSKFFLRLTGTTPLRYRHSQPQS